MHLPFQLKLDEDPSKSSPPVSFDEEDDRWTNSNLNENDMVDQNSAAYCARFLLCKVRMQHEKLLNLEMKNCSIYELHFSEEDLFCHLYTNFQRYTDGYDKTAELIYASREFINFILRADEAFEYIFDKYCNQYRIKERIMKFISKKVPLPKFCDDVLLTFFLDLYCRTKIEYKLKRMNDEFDKSSKVDQNKESKKFKTILHK